LRVRTASMKFPKWSPPWLFVGPGSCLGPMKL
jgi:hypothetical protein